MEILIQQISLVPILVDILNFLTLRVLTNFAILYVG